MEPLTSWLLTYLLHSTVLLGAAALVRLALGERRLALQEAVLRAALVGGLVTASLQVGLDLRPIGGARLPAPDREPPRARAPGPALAPARTPSTRPPPASGGDGRWRCRASRRGPPASSRP